MAKTSRTSDHDAKKGRTTYCKAVQFAAPVTKLAMGFLFFLGLLFTIVILFSLPTGILGVADYFKTWDWQPVSARIIRIPEDAHKSVKLAPRGESLEYTYQFGDQHYKSQTIRHTNHNHASPKEKWKLYQKASQHQLQCYVNPARPDEACLLPYSWQEIVIGTCGVLIFGTAGLGMLGTSISVYRKVKREQTLPLAHPEEPWLWKENWITGKIKAPAKWRVLVPLALALFVNLVLVSMWIDALDQEKIVGGIVLSCIFGPVGLAFLIWAVIAVTRRWKYGLSLFQMDSVPGVIGGQLSGVIHTSKIMWPNDGFHLRLCCITDRHSMPYPIHWSTEQIVPTKDIQCGENGMIIPVRIDISNECPETFNGSISAPTIWHLKVAATAPGIRYRVHFEVPVFIMD